LNVLTILFNFIASTFFLFRRLLIVVVSVIGFYQVGWCGNPTITPAGSVVKWPTMELEYNIDPGDLAFYSHEIVKQLVIKAFTQWNNVYSSKLKWSLGDNLDEDVTKNNFPDYIYDAYDGLNPIIFDSDGSILDERLGDGASEQILGISTPFWIDQGTIIKAEMVINGKLLKNLSRTIENLHSTLLHEIGHMSGLDHTQLFDNFAFDSDRNNNFFIPVMFPVEPRDLIASTTISNDDWATISSIYPTQEFSLNTGSISGTVSNPWGDAIQGANVVATNVDEPYVSAFSIVTDLYKNQTGEFLLQGLKEGNYEVQIEPINERFQGLSSVGPFSDTIVSPSFINPVIREYYNNERESGYIDLDNPEDSEWIFVSQGSSVVGIDFITNEEYSANVIKWCLY
jgi:hypothetical protein